MNIKKWLINKFFPAWAKVEIENLKTELEKERLNYRILEAYAKGLERGNKAGIIKIENKIKKGDD